MIIIAITLTLVASCYLIDYILAKKVKEANDYNDTMKEFDKTQDMLDSLLLTIKKPIQYDPLVMDEQRYENYRCSLLIEKLCNGDNNG